MRERSAGWLAALFSVIAVALASCSSPPAQPQPRSIRIATGTQNGPFHSAGEALATAYRTQLPDLAPEVLTTGGGIENVARLEREEIDIGFVYATMAYAGFVGQLRDQSGPFSRMRAMALLQRAALHVIGAPRSPVRRIEDLRGGQADFRGPSSTMAAEFVLRAFGLNPDSIRARTPGGDSVPALLSGHVEALFVLGTPPVAAVQAALAGGGRLLPVQGAPVDQMLREHPFYSALVIHADVYKGFSVPVATIGTNGVLLCRADLDDQLVYRLTKALYEAPSGASVDPVLAQWLDVSVGAATPVPLHPGAARYYRERELAP